MTKKIILSLLAIPALVVGVAALSAGESHIINVTATIENALNVPLDPINFGTVFPEETLNQPLKVALSDSFIDEGRVDDVDYVIRQKPKCSDPDGIPGTNSTYFPVSEDANGNFVCIDPDDDHDAVMLPLLCPFLSKHPDNDPRPGNDGSRDAFHGPLTNWTMADTLAWQVLGKLSKAAGDTSDTWNIDLKVPCFKGACAQDNQVPANYQLDPKLEHTLFGCDLWIETTANSISLPPTPTPTPTPSPTPT